MSSESPPIPAFTPVPLRARRDGWTPERQVEFIRQLSLTRCVDRAARAVGMRRETAYRLRRRPGAESFAAAWDAILAEQPRGVTAPSLLWHRAVYGVMKPIIRQGVPVGMLHRPDNRALLTLVKRFDRLAGPAERRLAEKSR